MPTFHVPGKSWTPLSPSSEPCVKLHGGSQDCWVSDLASASGLVVPVVGHTDIQTDTRVDTCVYVYTYVM